MRKHYEWENGPAEIEQHSIAKHNVLRAYLARYFKTLVSNPRQDVFRLSLIDGFAGGGQYIHKDTNQLVLGSPFICLDAVHDATIALNEGRRKPLKLEIQYFFVEKNRAACMYLEKMLRERGYGSRLGNDIHLRHAQFQDEAEKIIQAVRAHTPQSGRAIFVLDQFGYSDVPGPLIRKIFKEVDKAEVVLTFSVDSFLNYANDQTLSSELIRKMGLDDIFGGRSLDDIRASDRQWRLLIQSVMYKGLIDRCGASHYTPFFIRNSRGHGDYWLIHMSQHPRARDVMTEVHWANHNNFIHYGGSGLDMFQMVGYDPDQDSSFMGQPRLGFEFDDLAREMSIESLKNQFPKLIHWQKDGITFGQLFTNTCNTSPASADIYRAALADLVAEKLILITDKDGKQRRSENTIHVNDRIHLPPQSDLFFNP